MEQFSTSSSIPELVDLSTRGSVDAGGSINFNENAGSEGRGGDMCSVHSSTLLILEDDDDAYEDSDVNAHDDDDAASYCGSTSSSTYMHSQESFETFQIKVAELFRDIGLGDPMQIDRMEGGSYNRIIGVRFGSGENKDCILRIPRGMGDDTQSNVSDEISILSYLPKIGFAHVPKVLAYDITTKNALKSQWVLQERLPGTQIQKIFYSLPVSERLEVASLVASVILQLESTVVESPGCLIGKRNLAPTSYRYSSSDAGIEVVGFKTHDQTHLPMVPKQHLKPLLIELLEKHSHTGEWSAASGMLGRYSKLQTIVRQMARAGLIRESDFETVFWAWDLNSRNILIGRSEPMEINGVSKSGNCQRSVKITVDDTSSRRYKHSVQVNIEEQCNEGQGNGQTHRVCIDVEHSMGTKFRHSLEIDNSKISAVTENSQQSFMSDHEKLKDIKGNGVSTPKWEITGLLDWDDALAVPLVLTRTPPSWLWLDEEARSSNWYCGGADRDMPPSRDLTANELLIKAHFNQIMMQKSPSYLEDAYHRGVWLRRVARFAIHGFRTGMDWQLYDRLVADWKVYYESLGLEEVHETS
jgi:hypothetical protein